MPDYNALQVTMTTLLAFCAIMVAIWSAYKVIKEAKQPSEDRLKRLEDVEEHLDNDNKRLKDLEKASRLSLKAQLAILDHLTTGNHTEQLKDVRLEIQNYLLGR